LAGARLCAEVLICSTDWTAIATFALAGVTVLSTVTLGLLARRSAQAAEDSAAAADRSVAALEASVLAAREAARHARLPTLTGTAEGNDLVVSVVQIGIKCSLTLRNIGNGPALIEAPSGIVGGMQAPTDTLWHRARVLALVAQPGGELVFEGWTPGMPELGRFYVRVTYTDVLGEQRSTTYVHVSIVQAGGWAVTGEAIAREGQPMKTWGDSWSTEWLAQEKLTLAPVALPG
jgi:hypothetical protein